MVGVEVLPPILARLHQAHPELAIELALSNRVQDLLRRDADIAVRMVRPVQEALLTRHLGDVELGLYAHPNYLGRRGTPREPEELAAHALIGFDTETAYIRRLIVERAVLRRRMFALRTDSDLAQLAAIRAGFGIGGCQVALARRQPVLVRVLPQAFCPRLEIWLTMHEDLRASARCRTVYDALAAGLSDHLAAPA